MSHNDGYLLDTSTLNFILNGNRDVARRLRAVTAVQTAYCSVISEGELIYGALRRGKERKEELLEWTSQLLSDLTAILPVTREVASEYARIMREVAARGQMIGVNDLWIASTALAADLTLVTSDRGFSLIEGITLEDWLQP